jgi:hypothetical protein
MLPSSFLNTQHSTPTISVPSLSPKMTPWRPLEGYQNRRSILLVIYTRSLLLLFAQILIGGPWPWRFVSGTYNDVDLRTPTSLFRVRSPISNSHPVSMFLFITSSRVDPRDTPVAEVLWCPAFVDGPYRYSPCSRSEPLAWQPGGNNPGYIHGAISDCITDRGEEKILTGETV